MGKSKVGEDDEIAVAAATALFVKELLTGAGSDSADVDVDVVWGM